MDLNSLLFGLEQAIRAGCARAGDRACEADFTLRAAARHQAIDRYLWDETRGIYTDYRWTDGQVTGVLSAATLYPLFESLADAARAARVASAVRTSLLQPGGIERNDADHGPAVGCAQWLGAAAMDRRQGPA